MLAVSNLCAGYGRIPILNNMSFAVGAGEYVGVLGHNGMGKTTLLKTLMGFLPATAGEIRLDGTDISRRPPFLRARSGLGYVPQGRDIFPALSVRDNLRMGCAAAAVDEAKVLDATLAEFPRLQRLLDRVGGALSGGEQQLLALARCLCGGPRLILLDEPTEGIQPSIIEEIIETLSALKKRGTVALVLVEQNLEFIAAISDRVLIIQKGALVGEVSPEKLNDTAIVGEFIGMHA